MFVCFETVSIFPCWHFWPLPPQYLYEFQSYPETLNLFYLISASFKTPESWDELIFIIVLLTLIITNVLEIIIGQGGCTQEICFRKKSYKILLLKVDIMPCSSAREVIKSNMTLHYRYFLIYPSTNYMFYYWVEKNVYGERTHMYYK